MAGSDYQPECGPPNRDEIITCWCGERGTYEELFDDDVPDTCGGLGVLHCSCGGDSGFCVCHNHGEMECPGCEDCESDGSADFDDGEFGSDDYDGDQDDHRTQTRY
jgi:hypothetical protein